MNVVVMDFLVVQKGRVGLFGYFCGIDSEEDESDIDDDVEVIRVDNEFMDDGDELVIFCLGIFDVVVDVLVKCGIMQFFFIQVCVIVCLKC